MFQQQAKRREVKGWGLRRGQPLLQLEADDSRITAHIEVLVLDITQAVGEGNHAAVRKLDVKFLVVEVDVKLKK